MYENHNNKKYFRILLLYSLLFTTTIAQSCNTVPVSLSKLRVCEDLSCFFEESAIVTIPNEIGQKTCLKFISPSSTMDSFTFNVTLISTYYRYASDYHYFSDDIKMDVDPYCGCPVTSPVSCTSVEPDLKYSDYQSCIFGRHEDNWCVADWFNGQGTYAVFFGFTGHHRYQITHYNPLPSIDMRFLVEHDGGQYSDSFNGITHTTYDSTGLVNVTFISTSSNPPLSDVSFTVFDRTDRSDFYFLDNNEVNSLDSSDFSKIGIYQTDRDPVFIKDPASEITVKLRDCEKREFDITTPFILTSDYLKTRIPRLSHILAPNSILIDPHYSNNFTSNPSHNVMSDISYLDTGFSYEYLTEVFTMGIKDDMLFPLPQSIYRDDDYPISQLPNGELLTNVGVISNIQRARCISCPASCFLETDPDEQTVCGIYLCEIIRYNSVLSPEFTWAPIEVSNGVKTQFNMTLVDFPSFRKMNVLFENQVFKKTLFPESAVQFREVLIPPNQGNIELRLTFRNLSVEFQSSTVTPQISNVEIFNDRAVIEARSLVNPGQCFISSTPPGIVPAQPLTLSLQKTNYTVFFSSSYNGALAFNIICHQQKTTQVKEVDFNIDANFTDPLNEEVEDEMGDNLKSAFNPENLGHLINELFDGALNWQGYLSLIFYIAIAVAILTFMIVSFLFLFGLVTMTPWSVLKMIVCLPFVPFKYCYNKLKSYSSKPSNYVSMRDNSKSRNRKNNKILLKILTKSNS